MRHTISTNNQIDGPEGEKLNFSTDARTVSEQEFYESFDNELNKFTEDKDKVSEIKAQALPYLKKYAPVTIGSVTFEIKKK